MTFDEWLSDQWPSGFDRSNVVALKAAWNAALEDAALLVERESDTVHLADKIRDRKTTA